MTLSQFFTVVLALVVIQAVGVLVWVVRGIRSWKAELTNKRPMAALGVAMLVVVLEMLGLSHLTSASFWSPRTEASTRHAYVPLASSSGDPLDVKIIQSIDALVVECVLNDYARDPKVVSAWALGSYESTPIELSDRVAHAKDLCLAKTRADVALLDDEKQQKYSRAFDHALALPHPPAKTLSLSKEDQKALATFLGVAENGMLSVIRRGASASKSAQTSTGK